MKRIALIFLSLVMLLSLAARSTNGGQSNNNGNTNTTATPAEIEQKIADAIGKDNYLCDTDIDKDWLQNSFQLDMSKVESYVAKQNSIGSVNPDMVIILKTKDGYADEAVKALNTYFAQVVSYIRQYPFGTAKVLNARLYQSGDYEDEYIYYKTDHHFTRLGAYYCYAAWMQAQGKTAQLLSAWQSQSLCDNFRGTTYNKVNDPFAPYDTITAYYKTLTHTVSYNGGNYVTDSIYERKYLSGKDQYATFLNSNQSTTVVSGSGEGKLLILKDSYANCFSQFVIDDYAETHLIDLRFYKDSVTDYIEENGITQVLVLYNIPNFTQDAAVSTLQ